MSAQKAPERNPRQIQTPPISKRVEEIGRSRNAAGQFSALLGTEKEHSGHGTHRLWAQISHSLLYVVPSVPQTGFRSLAQGTKDFPSSVVCVLYLLQSTWQNKDKLLWRSSCYARKVDSKPLCSNVSVTGQIPVTPKLNLQSEIIFLHITLVLQELRKRTILEKRSFGHKNMHKIFSLVSEKNLEFGKKHFSIAVNLNNTVLVCVGFLHNFPAL